METKRKFQVWDSNTAVPFDGSIRVSIRADQLCKVYASNDEGETLLVGYGVGETQVHVTSDELTSLSYVSKGNVWIRNEAVTRTRHRDTDVVFTSLDRPPTLSPELQAIQRLARQNEIMRRHDLELMERRYASLARQRDRPVEKPAAKAGQDESSDDKGSVPKPAKPEEGRGDAKASAKKDDTKAKVASQADTGSDS